MHCRRSHRGGVRAHADGHSNIHSLSYSDHTVQCDSAVAGICGGHPGGDEGQWEGDTGSGKATLAVPLTNDESKKRKQNTLFLKK